MVGFYTAIIKLFIVFVVDCSVIPENDIRNLPLNHGDKSDGIELGVHHKNDVNLADDNPGSWFIHFIKNLSDYLIIILPVAFIVILVKHTNLFPQFVKQLKWIKLLVYGVNDNEQSNLEDGLPLVISDTKEKKKPEKQREKNTSFMHLLYCFIGLQISFLTWGILQEKIMTQSYVLYLDFIRLHPNQISDNLISIVSTDSQNPNLIYIKFRNAQFLVLVNRVLAFTIAVIVLIYRQWHQMKNSSTIAASLFNGKQPPLYMYMYCSLSNIMSSWCQYEALKYVSFPAQVLSKGCKMIPTMLMNRLMIGKVQKREEWFFALAISLGMTIFMLNEQRDSIRENSTSLNQSNNVTFLSGLIILALYLTFDSFTSNWQQSLFDQYRTLTSIHMMASVNFFSILFTMVSLIQQSDFFPAINLLFANSTLLRDCIILSICSASGQLFIFHTISTFGAIVFTLIMTLRQALAILLSCLIYSHSITIFGFLGILIIFGSLFTKTYIKFQEKNRNIKTKSNQNVI